MFVPVSEAETKTRLVRPATIYVISLLLLNINYLN